VFNFHKVVQVRYLREVNMFFMCVCKNFLPAYSTVKIILKIKRVFPELWSQN